MRKTKSDKRKNYDAKTGTQELITTCKKIEKKLSEIITQSRIVMFTLTSIF